MKTQKRQIKRWLLASLLGIYRKNSCACQRQLCCCYSKLEISNFKLRHFQVSLTAPLWSTQLTGVDDLLHHAGAEEHYLDLVADHVVRRTGPPDLEQPGPNLHDARVVRRRDVCVWSVEKEKKQRVIERCHVVSKEPRSQWSRKLNWTMVDDVRKLKNIYFLNLRITNKRRQLRPVTSPRLRLKWIKYFWNRLLLCDV